MHVRWCHFEFNAKVGSKGVQDISIEMSSKRIAIECANAMDFLTRAAHPWHALFGIWDLGWRRRDVGRANLKHLAVPTSITNHESMKSRFFCHRRIEVWRGRPGSAQRPSLEQTDALSAVTAVAGESDQLNSPQFASAPRLFRRPACSTDSNLP